ncbi:MAG: hypothetical protein IT463_05085 [Planctomycetes bacterium]|nr:hypothetical protein [Planctomycetota bacterium]
MVHVVKILSWQPRGSAPGQLAFELDGRAFHARCDADPALATGLLVAGTLYPVALTVVADGRLDYADPGSPSLKVLKADPAGDQVAVLGRTWDSLDRETIKLDAGPGVAVRLAPPQDATDFRGGSWLCGTGLLCADLPPEEHD